MFSHVNVGARDLPRLAVFYDAVLAPLGLARAGEETIGGRPGLPQRAGSVWPVARSCSPQPCCWP